MKTQTNIGKSKKWAIPFIVLMAVSATLYAQASVKGGYDREVVTMVEQAWDNFDQLAVDKPVLLVESTQDRKDELISNPRSGKDLMQVGYYQNSRHTAWYKIRNIVTKKPAVKCNACTKVVSTPYVVYLKPRVK
jgi:hypothetical protein